VISGALQVINTDPTTNYGMTNAQVIGSERHEASAVFGPGDLVFLNKGSSQGVEDGQMYDVFSDRTTRNFRAEVPISPAASGLIKIVHTSANLATAIVVNSKESIQQGDQVREASNAHSEELDYVKPGGPSATGGDEESLEQEIDSGDDF
jgi:hypothetical protein